MSLSLQYLCISGGLGLVRGTLCIRSGWTLQLATGQRNRTLADVHAHPSHAIVLKGVLWIQCMNTFTQPDLGVSLFSAAVLLGFLPSDYRETYLAAVTS